MDVENTSIGEGERGKLIVLMLVGAPGSGKSTFCENLMRSSTRPWVRISQDTIGNGKAGTKTQCITSAAKALKDAKSVFIDRCNLDRGQRADFMKLGGPRVEVHAVVLDLPAKLCIARSVKRSGHEGNLQGGKAAAVVNRMLQNKELPKLSEGFFRITFCQKESDVEAALSTYSALGQSDTLSSGCFGQKNTDTKVQLGIMKFFGKVEAPNNAGLKDVNSSQQSASTMISKEKNGKRLENVSLTPGCVDKMVKDGEGPENVSLTPGCVDKVVKDGEDVAVGSVDDTLSLNEIPTLAFPSISTADFQFNLEKASEIIVEKVVEFLHKIGSARLVLVDLSHDSKILSLVRAKAAQKNIDSSKFFTFVGDITQLHSKGGLRCNVIANAANWRLKAGGGGVNAAIFSAAGPSLEAATKGQATSLFPGRAVVVPLPPTSPLFSKEGVTHVIHVLGPNMNPRRPNYLNNDYNKGCKVLREAYSSLFDGFTSIVRNQSNLLKGRRKDLTSELSESQDHLEEGHKIQVFNSDQKIKREGIHESEKHKKCKGFQDELGADVTHSRDGNRGPNNAVAWGSWAQALYHIAMHPERHKNDLIEISEDVVVLNDLYPKAHKHLLVLARYEGLDRLVDVRKEHLQLLRTMHDVGLKWAEKFLCEDASLVFRIGYHSAPSMRQLHLHVISQDFNSKHLKNKKHWNSFSSAFFLDSVDVIEEVSNQGKATLKDDDNLLSMELRCHRCRSAHPNIPRLKSHISNCRAPFPARLLQNGRLVLAQTKSGIDS